MKSAFSKEWKNSVQPRKQKKYAANAPLHIKKSAMSVHLSKDLRQKYAKRSVLVRTGDKVKVLRGNNKGKEGKVEKVSIKNQYIHVTGIDYLKKDGSKAFHPLKASNLMITELNVSDKKRKAKLEKEKKAEKKEKSSDK